MAKAPARKSIRDIRKSIKKMGPESA
jgi:hypothetical protein